MRFTPLVYLCTAFILRACVIFSFALIICSQQKCCITCHPPPFLLFSFNSYHSASLPSSSLFLLYSASDFSRLTPLSTCIFFVSSFTSFFHPLFLFSCHLHFLPFVILPPCLVVWWPGTGTVQGILSDTTMRERCGTCCNSSNLGSPRNCTTSRQERLTIAVT